jgi:tripartite-type tricarboxylate transporter receptor subunit TctC
MRHRRILFAIVMGLGLAPAVAPGSLLRAEDYPAHTVTIINPFAAGGGTDLLARMVAVKLEQRLGKNFVVENKTGAGSIIAAVAVQKAAPDGYTLLMAPTPTMATNVALFKSLPYEPQTDFVPLALLAQTPFVLLVNPALPVKSVADLIALAKSKPGTLNYGSSGTGASNHLAAEMFKTLAQTDIVRVNYKGAGPALTALIAGELQLMFPTAGAVTPHLRAGRVKALAVTSAGPSALFPGVSALAATLPGYESLAIYGMFAPAGTPRAIIARLNSAIVRVLERAETKERFAAAGMEAAGCTPAELAATVQTETARMTKVIKAAGIHAD